MASGNLLQEYQTKHFVYQDKNKSEKLLFYMNKCRCEKRYVDITIEVEDTKFPCHRIVLESTCPYFHAFFAFHPRSEEQEKLQLQGVTLRGFKQLLNYMYLHKLTLTKENVIDVLECADFLQFRQIVDVCATMLFQNINSDNCIRVHQIAEAHLLSPLKVAAFEFILSHFEIVMESCDFLQMPQNLMNEILKHKYLCINNESLVLKGILNWTLLDLENRRGCINELLSCVMWDSVSEESVQELFEQKCKTSNSEVVIEFLKGAYKKIESLQQTGFGGRPSEILAVVSRDTNPTARESKQVVLYYDWVSSKWQTLTMLPFKYRCLYGVCTVDNNLYVTGGMSNDSLIIYNNTWAYSVDTNEWLEMKPFLVPRYNHGTGKLNRSLFVVGGKSFHKQLCADAEVFDPDANQWTSLSNIISPSVGFGNNAVVPLNGKMYVLGGSYSCTDSTSHRQVIETLQDAFSYDPAKSSWSKDEQLSKELEKHNISIWMGDCLSFNGLILISGKPIPGHHSKVYNPLTGVLTDFVLSHGQHTFAGTTICQDKLVCTGGIEKKFRGHDLVHYLDLTSNKAEWNMLTPLPFTLSHHACVCIYKKLKQA